MPGLSLDLTLPVDHSCMEFITVVNLYVTKYRSVRKVLVILSMILCTGGKYTQREAHVFSVLVAVNRNSFVQ